ncbi:TonB-dependent receptor [Novosphingobium album (ex Liu et al. 2023)]|uniref:TonB-dependent receptor n=1 Tax=Novosphingobium album (ex Liu et al. 2023) TaxID=3031130 RepID=A0ABT5WPQ0_9SPHN|nr:TonB-dependent receptor [Novosphingobium album (ex Liu et al. 2023)]MDE8651993.1 TonB-dependent receptor [Novosphingobium album (ex Liu et al. 2023)]
MTIGGKAALAAGTALAFGFGMGAPAFAQAPQDGEQHAAGADIIVTARRVEERLQDVPISITVFNQEQLSSRDVVNASDLATFTPSLSTNSNFGQENSSFAIRGFVQDAGTPPSVGVYFADVVALRGPTQGTQAGDGAGPGSFFDLQNVQVLKGPQGTLFGRNTTGGAILFVPKKPTAQFEGYVEGSLGNYGLRRLQGAINLPLGDDARVRFAADRMKRDGWLHNRSGIGPDNFNDVDYLALRASLVVDLTPDLENYLIVSYNRSDTNGSVQKAIGCNPTGYDPVNPATGLGNFIGVLSCGQLAAERAAGFGFYDMQQAVANPRSLLETWQVINTTTWQASDTLAIKNIISYGQLKNFQRTALFGTNWTTDNLPAPYPQLFFQGATRIFTGIFPIPGRNSAEQSTFTEELQLQGSALDGRLTYQAGGYLEVSNPLSEIGNQSSQLIQCADLANLVCTDVYGAAFTAATNAGRAAAGLPPLPAPINVGVVNFTGGKTSFRNVGLYTQMTYALTDQLKLTGGLRYTWDRQENEATRIGYRFPAFTSQVIRACTDPATAPDCSAFQRAKSDKPTWLLSLDYKPANDILLYAKYARGYRAGGVFTNAPSDLRSFKPEKVDSYELGLKSSFSGAVRGTFNISGFYNDFTNQQLQFGASPRVINGVPAPVSNTTAIINAGRSRIYGVEVEASLTPFDGLTLDTSYSYLNATIREIAAVSTNDPNYQISATAIKAGSELTLSPKHRLTATGTYTLPIDESIGRISIGATYTYTAKQRTNYVYLPPSVAGAPDLGALFGADLGLLGSTSLVNLNLSWNGVAGLPIDLAAFATNVTKEKYYTYIPGLGVGGLESAVVGQPRFYGMRLRYRFGD